MSLSYRSAFVAEYLPLHRATISWWSAGIRDRRLVGAGAAWCSSGSHLRLFFARHKERALMVVMWMKQSSAASALDEESSILCEFSRLLSSMPPHLSFTMREGPWRRNVDPSTSAFIDATKRSS